MAALLGYDHEWRLTEREAGNDVVQLVPEVDQFTGHDSTSGSPLLEVLLEIRQTLAGNGLCGGELVRRNDARLLQIAVLRHLLSDARELRAERIDRGAQDMRLSGCSLLCARDLLENRR